MYREEQDVLGVILAMVSGIRLSSWNTFQVGLVFATCEVEQQEETSIQKIRIV